MPEPWHIAAVLLGVIAFTAAAGRLERTPFTLPMVFTAFGWLFALGGIELVPMHAGRGVVHALAEITLILLLFYQASRVELRALREHWALFARMLLIGTPLTILLGTLVAYPLLPEASWAVALLAAAILAPTDAALGQAVMTSDDVPVRLRQSIGVESGLNDGLVLPVIMFAAVASARMTGTAVEGLPGNVWVDTLMQLLLGPLSGVGVGYGFARLLDRSMQARWGTPVSQGIYFLCTAFLAYFLAEAVNGNGLIAAFTAGLAFGHTLRSSHKIICRFMDTEGHVLTIATFLVFGAVMVPPGLGHATWRTLVLAVLFLTAVRMLPVGIALLGSGLDRNERGFLAWFGPRGLASILFSLLILDRFEVPGREEIRACVVVTVLLSIVLHGVSANLLAGRFRQCQA